MRSANCDSVQNAILTCASSSKEGPMSDADRMRDRLRELGRAAERPLSPELRERVVQRVTAFGPGLVRRSRRRQTSLRVAAIALPLALGAAWLGMRSSSGSTPIGPLDLGKAEQAADTTRAPRASERAARSAPARPACAEHPQPLTAASALAAGRRSFELGERGRIVLEAGGEAELEAADPCKLELHLAKGRVSVHAADLFGGELKVSAGSADVVVHGTTFAVERTGEQVTVDVDEGAVAVESSRTRQAPLVVAGQSLRLTGTQAPVLLAFSSESRQQLRAALAATAVVAEPEPAAARSGAANRSGAPSATGPGRLVARADKLWNDGDRKEARMRYREAGEANGPTAEAAWLALARRELSIGDADAARTALAGYAARFPAGELAAEAAGIEFRAALQKYDLVRADRIARKLVERYAGTPQAEAAARWRREHGARR
jgi:hypothetical protein